MDDFTAILSPGLGRRAFLALVALLMLGSQCWGQSLTINDVTAPEGDAGTTPFTFTVTLTPSSAATVTVSFATANASAFSSSDYLATTGTLTFDPGQTAKTITVDVAGDTAWEGTEFFLVNLSAATNATIADSQGLGGITNDDVQVSVGDVTVTEGDSGTTPLTFDVTLGAPKNNLTVTVNWATQNGGAVAPGDFTAASGTVTFLPGETAKTVTVDANGDTIWEGNEAFLVVLSSPVNCSLGDFSGTGFINNDDVQVSVGDATVTEGDSGTTTMTFNVTLGGPKNNLTLAVNWATQNSGAVAPADFTAASGTVTFLPGETAKTVTVDVNGDTTWEGNETFFVALSSPVNCSLGDFSGSGLINNDDVQVSVGDATMAEGDSGTTPMTFNLTLGGPKNNLTLTVNWTTQNGGAVAPADFTVASGTVTFLPGETAKTVSVNINGDTTWEGHEAFNVVLSNAVNCSLGDFSGSGLINNDDVQVSVGDATVMEGNSGTTPLTFDVFLGGPKNNLTLTVNWATQNGGAVAPGDFTAASGTVTFLPGETAKTVTVDVKGDLALEGNEAFTVVLSIPVNCSLGDFSGTGLINNDDVQGVLYIDDLSLPEGQSGTTTFGFTVGLTAPSVSTVSVQFTTANETAIAGQDYTAGFGIVTFAPGETSKIAVVNVGGDTKDECTETFFVNLVSPSGAPIGDSQAIGTIEEDENPGCADLDADCSQDSSCGGSDCDDLNADTYSGAIEINDGLDNQCPSDPGYGVADEIFGSGFLNPSDPTQFSWPAQDYATGYELVRASSRDFATNCTVLGSTTDTFLADPDLPPVGEALYYLVRATTPNVGSFGQTSSGAPRTVPCAP
ncbi:MAG: Calx-beta domain-containing protein [Candidatus Polarisedimenticolia bacterium]